MMHTRILLWLLAFCCLSGFLTVNLSLLDKDPPVNVDEPWISDAAFHFSQTGEFSPQMFQGRHFNLGGRYVWSIHQFLQSIVFTLAGFGLYQARFVSFLAGLGSLYLLFALGKHLYNPRTGILALFLFSFSPLYAVSRSARAEMTLTLFVLAAAYLFVVGVHRRSSTLVTLSGVVSGLACSVHLNGLMIVGALTASLLLFRTELRWTGPAFLIGALAAACWWLLVHGFILTETDEPASFRPVFGGARDYLQFTVFKTQAYLRQFHGGRYHNTSILGGLVVLSVCALAMRRSRSDLFLLTTIAAFAAFYVFVTISTNSAYLVCIFPFLCLSIAAVALNTSVDSGGGNPGWPVKKRYARLTLLAVAVAWASVRGANDLTRSYLLRGENPYHRFVSQLESHIPPGATIMGQPTWYYGLYRHRYIADRYFAWIARSRSDTVRVTLGRTFAEAIDRSGVQYLIIDSVLHERMIRSPGAFNSLPHEEVIPFLEDNCTLVGVVDEPVDGTHEGPPAVTRIYRVTRL